MPIPKIEFEINLDTNLPEYVRKVAIERGECEEQSEKIISQFRNYILEHNDFSPLRTDDAYLQKFLRVRCWKIEPSYILMSNYYKFRAENKSFYEKVRPLDLSYLGDEDVITVTPYRDQTGRRMLIYRFGVWNPAKVSVDDIFRATCVLLELGSMEPMSQVVGGIGIFDLKNLALSQIFHLSPSVAQKMIALLVTSMPVRTSALHIVNQNWVFNAAYNMFKPFINTAMKERLFIHGSDMTSLHKHIDPDCLPKRYGGIHEDYPYARWFENLPKFVWLRKDMEQLGYVFPDYDPNDNQQSDS